MAENNELDQIDINQSSLNTESLSLYEADMLIFMREEEKLARDVYLTLYERWNSTVFSNIARSEQKHMDSMAQLIDTYNLIDPVIDESIGSLVNPDLATLYDQLIAKGQLSLLDALFVGALIEEIDIVDLQQAIDESDQVDISQAYENLLRGSRDHLRAFVRQIEKLGVPYEAQILDQFDLDMIVDGTIENGGSDFGTVSNDFNGDGKSDIFWRHDTSNANMIYFMNGHIISDQVGFSYQASSSAWTVTGNSDFNNDGKTDTLWRNANTGETQIALMNGAALATGGTVNLATLATSWKVGGVGDFDGDGNDDIFWHNDNGQNQISFTDGQAGVTETTIVNTINDSNWKVVGIADFDQDGKDDVIWRNDVNKRVWIYLMNGSTITNGGGEGEHVVFTAANWNIDGVGDFNGDGKGDILWRNDNNGRVWMFLDVNDIVNQFAATGTDPLVLGEHVAFTALVWQIQTVGDYNGDGKSDILWRHSTTGWNHMYLMNGATPDQQLNVNTLSDLGWIVK